VSCSSEVNTSNLRGLWEARFPVKSDRIGLTLRVTIIIVSGLQMYDSEHALGPHKLKRHSDWEIHPVFALDYCPTGKTCTKDKINGANLDIQCKHGVVTLRGRLETPTQKTRAEAFTRTVKGVKRVVNLIKVGNSDVQ